LNTPFHLIATKLTIPLSLVAIAVLSACSAGSFGSGDPTVALQAKVKNVVVIYAENRSFDNLYSNFPGANGLQSLYDGNGNLTAAYVAQKDRNGNVLAALPPTWGGVTAGGITPVVTQAQSMGLANAPFKIETAYQKSANVTLSTSTVTRDLYHRFFENQMQINGGKNDMFAAWADAGGLTMGSFDYSSSSMFKLAQQYVLADNFFQGAYGGSFLNHQYLVCACAPEYPNADSASAKPTIAVLDKDSNGNFLPKLTTSPASPASAMDGAPVYTLSGNIAPANYFGDGKFRAVNTMQAPYQPSGNAPANLTGNNASYADTNKATTLPPQTTKTIADMLDAKNVGWKWYGGSWSDASKDGMQDPSVKRSVIYTGNSYGVSTTANVDFQPHHQPFNYYASMDPVANASYRAAHLQDYKDLVADAAAGTLPPVAFYKPEGLYNQHEGYANLADGDAKIADVIAKLQASPQWSNMVVVITYDEFGGAWDHVVPPKGDQVGPGTRIPAIVVSPLANKGTVDHTQYDTASVLRLITRVFGLSTLPGVTQRDNALKAAGNQPMGDLTNALNLN